MKVIAPLGAVLALVLLAYILAPVDGVGVLFGVVIPYAALAIFVGGFVYRVLQWAKVPVPFHIPTTCGQQKSLPWIKDSPIESPATKTVSHPASSWANAPSVCAVQSVH